MDDFLVRALLGGLGIALAAGPLGCFVVWRRMAYFGATLAHSALLGVALGFWFGIDLTVGIVLTCLAVAAVLAGLEHQRFLAVDTLLGVLAHVTLAAGLLVVALMPALRVDLLAYLFGDVLSVSAREVVLIYVVAAIALAGLAWLWRPLLAITVNEDLAAVEGVKVARVRIGFILILAAVVAVGMKLVGMLLIIALLIIPAAAARRWCRTPESMAVLATLIGMGAVALGLVGSFQLDVPSGPMIVLVASAAFAVTLALRAREGHET